MNRPRSVLVPLVNLFDERILDRYLTDPEMELPYAGSGAYSLIWLLVSYYKWVGASESQDFAPGERGMIHRKFLSWNASNIQETLHHLANVDFRRTGMREEARNMICGNETSLADCLEVISRHATDARSGMNYLPPRIRHAFLDTEDFCVKCMSIVSNPKIADEFRDLYFRFKIWGVEIYDQETGNLVSLDQLCQKYMREKCSEDDYKIAMGSRMDRSLGVLPEELREKISGYF